MTEQKPGGEKHLLQNTNHRVGALYDFVMVCTSMMNVSTPYRGGIKLTVVEAMTVVVIAANPGITSTQLCHRWRRSRGNISQLLKKLEEKGLIAKENKPQSNKEIALYPTDEGIRLYHQFMMNDSADTSSIAQKLLETCTIEELKAFYRVIDCYTAVLTENPELQWSNYIRSEPAE